MVGDIQVKLEFLKPLELYKLEKPYRLFIGKPPQAPNIPLTNVEMEEISGINVMDARGQEPKFDLDEHGFQFVKHSQPFPTSHDEETIQLSYIPQVESFIKQNVKHAKRVFIFDWRVCLLPIKCGTEANKESIDQT